MAVGVVSSGPLPDLYQPELRTRLGLVDVQAWSRETDKPTIHEAMRRVAQLGGFLGHKSDGEPGAQTLWRGLQRLDDLDVVVRLEQVGEGLDVGRLVVDNQAPRSLRWEVLGLGSGRCYLEQNAIGLRRGGERWCAD